jgi:hypothetical protein
VLLGEILRYGLERQFNRLVLPHGADDSTLCDSVNIRFNPGPGGGPGGVRETPSMAAVPANLTLAL